MPYKKYISILMIFWQMTLYSQNNTNSPYSGFGIGELQLSSGGQNMGMGQTGIALRDRLFLNTTNPAAMTALEPEEFLLDFGMSFKYTQLKNATKSVDVNNGNISWIQLGFPISKKFFGGFSLNPKSSVGYKIYTKKTLDGTADFYPAIYEGTGGLSEAAATVAYKFNDNISLGAKAGYLWGNVVRTTYQDLTVSSIIYTMSLEEKNHYSGAYLNLGTQLILPLSAKNTLTLGAIMGISSKLNSNVSATLTKTYDTASEVIYNNVKTSGNSRLPMDIGAGIAYTFGSAFTTTFDFKHCNWEKALLPLNAHDFVANNSYRAGMEFILKDNPGNYRQVVKYRLGYRYETGYLKLYNNYIHERALTFGIGFPLRKSRNYSNISVEMAKSGTLKANLVQEKYIKLICSFNLWENMFVKRKFD